MEENQQVNPLSNGITSNQENIVETGTTKKEGKNRLIVGILSILVVILSIILIYLFMNGSISLTLDKTDSDISTEIVDDGEEEVVEEMKYTGYSNENFGVKLDFPTNWVILEESEDGDMAFTLKIGENSDSEKDIFLFEIKPSEIDKCIYSEANLTVSDGPTYEVLYDNYVSIGVEDNYRRSFAKYGEIDSFIVCKKGDNNIFRKGNPAFITYWNFDQTDEDAEEKLEILDNIVLSYEYLGE